MSDDPAQPETPAQEATPQPTATEDPRPTTPAAPPAWVPPQQPPHVPGYPPPPGYWAPRPPQPGFFETRWKGPSTPAGRIALVAALAGAVGGAVGGAVAVPLDRPGIGWLIAAVISAVGVGTVARRTGATVSTEDRIARLIWGAAALALMSVGTWRAAGWLFFCCLLASLGCASLAAAGGRSLRAMAVGALSVPIAALRSLPWLGRGLGAQLTALRHKPEEALVGDGSPAPRKNRGGRIVLAIILTVFLLLVFGALFASADDAFAELLSRPFTAIGDWLEQFDTGRMFVWTVLLIAGFLFTAGGIYLVTSPPDLHRMESPGKGRVGGLEFALPMGALVLLFGTFVAVQFTVLFADRTNILRTAKTTYAEYARSGFRQLIFVTVLTLIVIAGAARWGRRETPRERLLLRILLGGIAALSLVIVASAIYRLWLYQDYRGWTRERIFIGAVEIGFGLIFVLILIAGIKLQGHWLPRAVAGAAVVMLLSLAAVNPEGFMASQNVARYEQSHKIIDLFYLRALSADATPALEKLPPEMRRCALSQIARDLKNDPDPWYAWNSSRENARDILAKLGPGALGTCREAYQFDQER
jgi:hypothetical protein